MHLVSISQEELGKERETHKERAKGRQNVWLDVEYVQLSYKTETHSHSSVITTRNTHSYVIYVTYVQVNDAHTRLHTQLSGSVWENSVWTRL